METFNPPTTRVLCPAFVIPCVTIDLVLVHVTKGRDRLAEPICENLVPVTYEYHQVMQVGSLRRDWRTHRSSTQERVGLRSVNAKNTLSP